MEFNSEIKPYGPKEGDMMFPPYVRFRIKQLNPSLKCMSDREIDEEISRLAEEVEIIRKQAKKALRKEKSTHDEILEKKRK